MMCKLKFCHQGEDGIKWFWDDHRLYIELKRVT